VPSLVQFDNKLAQFFYNLALQIRSGKWRSLYLETQGGLYSVSVRLLQVASMIFGKDGAEDISKNGFEVLLNKFESTEEECELEA
jgi:hypothetical protein